jgi:hypothetical protein
LLGKVEVAGSTQKDSLPRTDDQEWTPEAVATEWRPRMEEKLGSLTVLEKKCSG